MSRHTLLLLLSLLLITGCGAMTPHKAPSLAQGHVGQVVAASSSLQQGKSILDHAHSILDNIVQTNTDVLRRAESNDLIGAKRRMFDLAEINDPRDQSGTTEQPGLRATINKALFHTQQAARTGDSSETIRRGAPDIWRKANRILEDSATLGAYINSGLNADSAESLIIIAGEIDAAARQISGAQLVAGGYSLQDLERDLEIMLARNNEQLIEADDWYLQNFNPIPGTDDWAFKARPQE